MAHVLEKVDTPDDLQGLTVDELRQLSVELREMIIKAVSKTGGHLAANLGVVELTLALLRTFSPPTDKLVWDTGHQTYAYKILTGRKDRFHTLRQYGGLSGFLRRDESPCDAFGAGHAGTALSAALGMAVARDRRGSNENVVAVLGDASASCGISLEALNNVAETTSRLVVVLNDNEMSISENVGSMSRYLGSLLAHPRYNQWKRSVESVATRMRMGWLRSTYYRLEEATKSLFLGSVIFEEFGLRYVGPIDGHDFGKLLHALQIARNSDRPIILHVSTQKGRGYSFAEEQPTKWHGTSCFDVPSGLPSNKAEKLPGYSDVFGQVLKRMAARDTRICAITAGMCTGTGLTAFSDAYADRFFDVGISEEHAAVFAAGLAAEGMRPIFAVYATFLQRAVDCVVHDICLQNLPVVICLDRAGVVGDDGPTHHGVMDIVLLRSVPGLVMMQPKDEAELAAMLATALACEGPVVIRYPRGSGPGTAMPEDPQPLPVGRAEVLAEGRRVAIWALGDMLPLARDAAGKLSAKGIDTGVVNARFIRPLDRELLHRQAQVADVVVTVENGVVAGGFGSALLEELSDSGFRGSVVRMGWPDKFVPHGPPARLMEDYDLTADALVERVLAQPALADARPS